LDNLTHSLIGLTIAKAGAEKLSTRATITCLLAANAPDSDIVVLLFGDRWDFLHHHRGITHSLVGVLALALVLPLLIYLIDRVVGRIRSRPQLVSLKGLTIASLLACATHPIMDWTNNYGIRFFLPWSGRWQYGDFVFIVDPFLWLMFGGAVFLLTARTRMRIIFWIVPSAAVTYLIVFGATQRGGLSDPTFVRIVWISGLVALFVLYRLSVAHRWESKIAVVSLLLAVIYLSGLAYAHRVAVQQTGPLATMIANQNGESVLELVAMPTLANPFYWQTVFETDRAMYRFNVRLNSEPDLSQLVRYEKPSSDEMPVLQRALEDRRSKIFMEFARFPVTRIDPNCVNQTLVQFADLRYTEPGNGRGTFSLDVPVECPPRTANE
jgi:inner membrane protein